MGVQCGNYDVYGYPVFQELYTYGLTVSRYVLVFHFLCKLLEKEGVRVFLSGTFSDDQRTAAIVYCWQMETVLYVNGCMWSESMLHCLVGVCTI